MKLIKLFLIVVAIIIMITAICVASFGNLKPMPQQFVFSLGIIIPGCIILLALRDDRVYRCCNCGHEHSPSDKDMMQSKGSAAKRPLKCPSCNQICDHQRVYRK